MNVNSYSEHVGKGRANWSWKSGVCVVESCSTRPGRTRVGPCSICKNCQTKFDKGQDPTKSAVPKIERKRDEPLGHKRKEASIHAGQTVLRPRIERTRGEPLKIDHKIQRMR